MNDELFGICKTCKNTARCCQPLKPNGMPADDEQFPCKDKINEVGGKYLHWADEYGNSGIRKLELTREETLEIEDYLRRVSKYSDEHEPWKTDMEMRIDSRYRHEKSEYIFRTTGVRTSTPENCSYEEKEDFYWHQSRQKGVCTECIVRPNCSEKCDAKKEEEEAEWEKKKRIFNAGLCENCEAYCAHGDICIERKKELKKDEES